MTASAHNESDMNQQNSRRFANASRQTPGFLGKLLAFSLSAGLFVLAFMFSLAALVFVAVGGVLLGGWLWWKTRAVRKQMRAANSPDYPSGNVIEGEVIRTTDDSIAAGERQP